MHGHKDERTRDELAALGYEREDIGLRTIAVWVFWFFAFATFAGVATAGIYQLLVPGGVAPKVVETRQRYPAEPRLQDEVSVKTDIYDLRAHENKELTASGPSSYWQGSYKIPVDHAIKLWAQQNSPGSHAPEGTTIVDGMPDVIVKPEPGHETPVPSGGSHE
jgi:hypothetical protein